MSKLFFFFLLLLPGFSSSAQSYADQLLAKLSEKVAHHASHPDPVEQLMLAERIYYLAHETGQQDKVVDLLESLLAQAKHQELKAEIGFFLIQHYRQISIPDKVEALVKMLGYVPEWRVLGPLAPDSSFKLKNYLGAGHVKGLDRRIKPQFVRSYGAESYWSLGLGHYGYFNANNLIYPTQLAGALYTTSFQLKEQKSLRLGLGWSHQSKVWINSTVVHEEKANHSPHPDQAVISFALKKGWHQLSIFVGSGSDDANLGIYARLTDSDGQPIPTVTRRKARLSRKKPKLLKSRDLKLVEMAHQKSSYALASMLLLKEDRFNEVYDAPKDLLTRALATEAMSQEVAVRLISLTDDPNQKWQILQNLLKKTPSKHRQDRAWALTQMGQIALGQRHYWEARKFAANALVEVPEYWPAQVVENNTLSALSLDGLALRNTLALAEKYPGVPWIMMDLSDLYWDMDFREESRVQTELVLKLRRVSNKFVERKIEYLKRSADPDALEGFYDSLLQDSPFSVATLLTYVQFLQANRRFEKAEELLSEFLAMTPENPLVLERMGELMLDQNRTKQALPFLEKALALRPQNPDLEKLIAFNKQGEKNFYEPYMVADTSGIAVLESSPIEINVNNTVVKLAPNGQSSTFHQLEWLIQTEQGIQELPGYSFSYSPLRQSAEIVYAEVVRDDQIIHITQFSRARISDPTYRMYYDLLAYQVTFPSLQVGDIVRVAYRVDDVGATNIFGDYFGDLSYFSNRYPSRQITYTLIVPQGRTIHYHVEKMKPQFTQKRVAGNKVYRWSLTQAPSFETESRMPGLAGYMPYVAVSTFNDWQNMAMWYSNLIEDQLKLDYQTRSIAQELAHGINDRLEIVKKIHEYVITNTRYVALEFGIHGYKPYEVNEVCSRQFGDCKDKASLIVSMLREVGIPASISIVRTVDKGYVHTYPAMLSYFNHAIAYVPELDLFLDGTAEFSGINELPAMDQGGLTLVVDANGVGKLTKIPVSSNNLRNYALDVTVMADGMSDVSGSLSYNGVSTPRLRQYLAIDTKLAQNLQSLMRETLPGLDVLEADREGRSINEPITLHFKGQSSQLLHTSNGQMSLPLRILGDQLTQRYTPNAKRQYPIEFGVPKVHSVELTIGAPKGFKLGVLPDSLQIEDENFSLSLKVARETKQSCRLNYQINFKTTRVEPRDYPNLRKLLQAHDRALDQSIQFVQQ